MKMKDLVVGEFYAYQDSKWSSVQRVRVDEINVYRPTRGPWEIGRSGHKDGVLVKSINAEGTPCNLFGALRIRKPDETHRRLVDSIYDPDERVYRVLPRFIISTWDEHVESVEREAQAKANHDKSNDEKRASLQAEIDDLPSELGTYFKVVEARGVVEIAVKFKYNTTELVGEILNLLDKVHDECKAVS